MKKFITASDITALIRQGKSEYVMGAEEYLTDLARETAKRRGIRLIRQEDAVKDEVLPAVIPQVSQEREVQPPMQMSIPPVKMSAPPVQAVIPPVPSAAQVKTLAAVTAGKPLYDIVIKGGTVVLPEAGCIRANICIKDGKIASLTNQAVSGQNEIQADGLYVLPGIIDPHTHLGLFSSLEEELETETRSAILGGVTTIGTFFNRTGSYIPLMETLNEQVPKRSRVDMFPHFTLREDGQLAELPHYSARGMNSFKVYMCGIPGLFPHQEDGFIVRCMQKLKQLDADPILCVHAENASIVEYATMDMETRSMDTLREFGKSHPNLSEGEAVLRTAYLSKEMNFRTYIVHTSCKESIETLRKAKHDKLYVETTSPYLSLDTESGVGAYGKMLPPFRTPESRQALWDGIREGLIDTIGTDNTTITSTEKKVFDGMEATIAGYPALGTHLVSVLNEGFFRQEIPIEKLVPLMTMNPAKIFGIYPQKGTLLPGADADVVLVDMNSSRTVDPKDLMSRSDFSIFQGKTLRAWPCGTIKGGRIVAWNGKLTDDVPTGKILKHCMK